MLWILAALAVSWVALQFKASRPDGVPLKTHPYRRMMFHLMPTRAESLVYYDIEVDAAALEAFVAETSEHYRVNVTHCVVAAWGVALSKVPKMNRFTMGRRLYQRHERAVSFSMKRRKLDAEAALAVVKMRIRDDDSFESFARRVEERIGFERSGQATTVDKELSFFLRLPRAVLNAAIPLLRWLDYHGLLPKAFIGPDPMYASAFIANLGSLGMRAGFHHLFEWGNCPVFAMCGRIEERVLVVDGQPVVRRVLPLRFTYDERIDDGLNAAKGVDVLRGVLEAPAEHFGAPGIAEADAPRLS